MKNLRLVVQLLVIATLFVGRDCFAALALDENFQPPRFVRPRGVLAMLLLPDGKFLRFLNAQTLVDRPAGAVTRYLPDGSLDTSFQFPTDFVGVSAALALRNGKLLFAVNLHSYDDEKVQIVRANADGSIDTTFTVTDIATASPTTPASITSGPRNVSGLAEQNDGKIIVMGPSDFDLVGNEPRAGIVRLLAEGGVDSSFAAVDSRLTTSGTSKGTLAGTHMPTLQPDGKIVIYGNFRRIGNANFPAGVARLNADGTVDSSFQPSGFSIATGRFARAAILQADGKILLGGRFSVAASFASNPTGSTYANLPIVRLNPDGSADQSYGAFNPPPNAFFSLFDLAVQTDGRIVAADLGGATVERFKRMELSIQVSSVRSSLLKAAPERGQVHNRLRCKQTGRFWSADNSLASTMARLWTILTTDSPVSTLMEH